MQLIVFGQFIIVVCIPMIHICIPVDCIWTFMNSPWMSMVSRAVSRCAQGVGAAVAIALPWSSGEACPVGPRGVVVPWGHVWCVCVCDVCVCDVCVICYTVSHICCISCISCMCGMAAVKLEWSHSSLQNLSCVIYFDHIPVLSLDAAFFFSPGLDVFCLFSGGKCFQIVSCSEGGIYAGWRTADRPFSYSSGRWRRIRVWRAKEVAM